MSETLQGFQPSPRKPWSPAQGVSAADRQAHAAEHVAMCLDRIDQNLQRIADFTALSATSNTQILEQLTELKKALVSRG
jgi:hypothetical protein